MESVIIPVSRAALSPPRSGKTQSQSIGDRSPGDGRCEDFIKDSLNTFIKGGLVSLLMITGHWSFEVRRVRHNKTPCPTGSSRTSDASPRGQPEPQPYPAGDWAQYWRACRAVIFRLHRPASRRHGCLTRRRDKHYQPNEGKAAVWCLLRFGAGTLPVFGYMPARRLGLGEDLPAPAMLQWGRWSAMPEYFYDDPEWDARQRAGKITLPILVLGLMTTHGLIQKPSHACLLQRKTQK